MSKFSIEVLNYDIPDHLKINGKVFLSLPADISYETIETNISLDEDNQNNVSAANEIDLDSNDPVNKLILSPLIDAHVAGQSFDTLLIRAIINGEVQPYDGLYVDDKNDEESTFTIVLTDRENNPLVLASETFLNKLIFGFFTYSRENIEAQFDDYIYEDGDPGYIYKFAWYGRAYDRDRFIVEDLRPWFSPLHLIRKGLAEFGWQFKSPILETQFFRKVWCYLSDSTYGGNGGDNLDEFKFFAQLEGPVTLGESIIQRGAPAERIDIPEVFDNGNDYTPIHNASSTSVYSPPPNLSQELFLEFDIDISNIPREGEISIKIFSANEFADGVGERVYDLEFLENDENQLTGTISGQLTSQPKSFFRSAYIVIDGPDELIINNLKFYNEPRRLRYIENQFLLVAEAISPDLTLYNKIKGMEHLFQGFLTIDYNTQVLSLDVSYDVDVFTEAVNGHLKENPKVDLTEAIMCYSKKMSTPDRNQSREIIYGFKNPSDAYIKSFDKYDDANPFDKLINLGRKYEDSTNDFRNPLFEPTIMIEVKDVSDNLPIHLPALMDNYSVSGSDLSFDVGFRISLATPPRRQEYLDDEGNPLGICKIRWYDQLLEFVPIFYQDISNENFNLLEHNTSEVLVYGNHINDFWNKYLQRKALASLLSQAIQFNFYMNPSDRYIWNINHQIDIQYQDEYITGFIDDVRYDHVTHQGLLSLTVPIETSDFIQNQSIAQSGPNTPLCSNNKPKVIISYLDGNVILEPGGTNDFPLANIEYQWRITQDDPNGINPNPWQVVFINNDVRSFPNPSRSFDIRVTFNYAPINGVQCGSKTIIRTIDPCGNLPVPELEEIFSVPNKLGGRRINLNNSVFPADIASLQATVRINSGAPVPYNIDPVTLYGEAIYEFDETIFNNFILQTLEITFINGCSYSLPEPLPEVEIPLIFSRDEPIVDGGLEIRRASFRDGGAFIPVLDNLVLTKQPEEVRIIYRNDESPLGETYNKASGPIGNNPEFRLAIHYNNPEQLIYTEWVNP